MRLGVHIRIGGGLVRALDRALKLECEAIQLFSGNPNGWARTPLDPDIAAKFAARATELDMHPIVLHTPYLVNLASPDDDIWRKSTMVLADAVGRAPLMGAGIIVTHIGSHKGEGYHDGVRRIGDSVRRALEAAPEPCIALEMGAGSGHSIGSRFEQIEDILNELSDVTQRVGVGIDTAHLWGAGYDISTAEGVEAMFALLKQHAGLEKLKVVHLNDTQMLLDSRRDRHYHIGKGLIGVEGFRAIVNYPGTENLPGIIETPTEDDDIAPDIENLATLRSLRK